SEKILFGEIGAGQTITVDVEGWNGEGAGEDAKFTFTGKAKLTKSEPVEDKPVAALAGDAQAASGE
ncbi:Clp protease, partial [Nocardia sp. JCM 34519.1]|uniref:Clp protease n=1 Tax=Nocardia sp. JCM 34519.1 TaxID=2876119 RepID=UPI001CE47569